MVCHIIGGKMKPFKQNFHRFRDCRLLRCGHCIDACVKISETLNAYAARVAPDYPCRRTVKAAPRHDLAIGKDCEVLRYVRKSARFHMIAFHAALKLCMIAPVKILV